MLDKEREEKIMNERFQCGDTDKKAVVVCYFPYITLSSAGLG